MANSRRWTQSYQESFTIPVELNVHSAICFFFVIHWYSGCGISRSVLVWWLTLNISDVSDTDVVCLCMVAAVFV